MYLQNLIVNFSSLHPFLLKIHQEQEKQEIPAYGLLEWSVGLICAFFGGWFAKQIEYQSSFGDQFYFLRRHKHFVNYTLIYGCFGILSLVLMHLGVYQPNIVPNLEAESLKMEAFFLISITGFVTGFSSKALLDVPLSNKESGSGEPVSISLVIKYFYPNPVKDAHTYISHHKTNYFENATVLIQEKEIKVEDLYELLTNLLHNIPEYQEGKTHNHKFITFFRKLHEENRTYDKLLFIYQNLGRKHFENIMEKLGIKKIPRHKRINKNNSNDQV